MSTKRRTVRESGQSVPKAVNIEVNKRLHEQFPMAGSSGGEDSLWRSLTAKESARDLNTITQRRMHEIAFWLFDTNPMAHRIIELTRDYVVGDGFTYKCKDPKVKQVVDDFWHNPRNDLDCTIDENVMELCLFGENVLPLLVNPVNGAVEMSYIDPAWVVKINKDKRNPRWNSEVIWKAPRGQKEHTLDIIHPDNNPRSKTYGKLVGSVAYFSINKPINATRGRSDLLCLSDWLDGHDQFLFARLERAFLLNAFIWDIEAQGMNTKAELDKFVQDIGIPRAGSIRAHNEKVKWNAVSPKLEASDASDEARLFRTQILGGAGYPEHWFGEPSKTTRATALETAQPTLRKLKSRQNKVKYHYQQLLKFVIDQAIIHGTLPEDVDTAFEVISPNITSRDDRGLAQALSSFTDSLVKAVSQKWLTNDEAASAYKTVTSQIGVEELAKSSYDDKEEKDDYTVVEEEKDNE
jgi:hypothetical protein